MCSTSLSYLSLAQKSQSLFKPWDSCSFLYSFVRFRNPRLVKSSSVSASIEQRNSSSSIDLLSWGGCDDGGLVGFDEYNGWAFVEKIGHEKRKGLPTFVLVGIGTSVLVLLAAVSHFSFSRKGFVLKLSIPFRSNVEIKPIGSELSPVDDIIHEATPKIVSVEINENLGEEVKHTKSVKEKPGRVVLPVTLDSTQQEALLLLKKLKIVEDDVKADELCTRREYARWLVLTNSLLERNPRHRIVPSVALSGSTISAFDDISVEDPDFQSIQSLAEVGIVPSKLSGKMSNSDQDDSNGLEGLKFFPDRFISRQDLINWKAKLEYKVILGLNEEISMNIIGFLDAREIRSDALVELFVDMLAGDKSILRKVFGQGKRFQPSKPCTKAQAAVALTSGRMSEAISSELSKRDAENGFRQNAMREIKSDLLERGVIQRYWDNKFEEENIRSLGVEREFLASVSDLEEEKIVQENAMAAYSKEKAALDCQKKLLSKLKDEVEEMSVRLAFERVKYVDDHHSVHNMLSELEVKHEGMLNAKSILEAETEALRILRSWIEEEAKKGQARAKVLEEVGRRWKWQNNP